MKKWANRGDGKIVIYDEQLLKAVKELAEHGRIVCEGWVAKEMGKIFRLYRRDILFIGRDDVFGRSGVFLIGNARVRVNKNTLDVEIPEIKFY